MSEAVLKKRALHTVLAFAHPLTGLADQVRQTRQTVNEYELELSMPDRPNQAIDVFASLLIGGGRSRHAHAAAAQHGQYDRAAALAPGRRALRLRHGGGARP